MTQYIVEDMEHGYYVVDAASPEHAAQTIADGRKCTVMSSGFDLAPDNRRHWFSVHDETGDHIDDFRVIQPTPQE